MLTARLFLCSCLCLGFATLAVVACGEDTTATPEADGGRRDTGTTGEEEEDGGGNPDDDGGPDRLDGASCDLPSPSMDGGFACGTYEFGKPFAPNTQFVGDSGLDLKGGALLPGIYDLVSTERASTLQGGWQETVAIDATGRFVRTRQITIGSNPGAVTRRSGSVTVSGNIATFTYDCAWQKNDAGESYIDAGSDGFVFELDTNKCDPILKMNAGGARQTYRLRK